MFSLPFVPRQLQTNVAAISPPAVPAEPFKGALVRKASDQTGANYSTATIISWDSEVYDTAAFHDAGDPTKLTVPVAYNGYYGIISAMVEVTSVTANSNLYLEILKSGSQNYDGRSGELRSTGGGAEAATTAWIQCSTQPIVLATGDYFEARMLCGDTSVTVEAENSSFSIRIVGATIDGALVKKAADQTAANFNFTVITWDSEVYDTGAYHDTGSNTSRITVPSGANGKYGIAKANARLTSVSTAQSSLLYVQRSATLDYDGAGQETRQNGTFTEQWMEAESAPVLLTTGQYFEAVIFSSDTSTSLEQEHSTLGLQVLGLINGALVRKASDQTLANYSTPTIVTWDTEVYDTDGFHDSGSNTKLTVPSLLNGRYGVLQANIDASAMTTNSTVSLCILKNGSTGYNGFGAESKHMGNFSSVYVQCRTQPILLSTGDYFEARFYSSDTSITVTAVRANFSILIVG